MMRRALTAVLMAAAVLESVLAGGALTRVLVQLPARQRVGAEAYAAFIRATDLGNGRLVYPLLGICGLVATLSAFGLALRGRVPGVRVALGLASASALGGLAITMQSLPAVGQLQDASGQALAPLLDRTDQAAVGRAVCVALTAGALLWTLGVRRGRGGEAA